MDGEDYKALRDAEKERNAKRQKFNSELCFFIAAECGFEVKAINEYQLRVTIGKKQLDYYPISGKATWLKKPPEWFRIPNIEKFLLKESKKL